MREGWGTCPASPALPPGQGCDPGLPLPAGRAECGSEASAGVWTWWRGPGPLGEKLTQVFAACEKPSPALVRGERRRHREAEAVEGLRAASPSPGPLSPGSTWLLFLASEMQWGGHQGPVSGVRSQGDRDRDRDTETQWRRGAHLHTLSFSHSHSFAGLCPCRDRPRPLPTHPGPASFKTLEPPTDPWGLPALCLCAPADTLLCGCPCAPVGGAGAGLSPLPPPGFPLARHAVTVSRAPESQAGLWCPGGPALTAPPCPSLSLPEVRGRAELGGGGGRAGGRPSSQLSGQAHLPVHSNEDPERRLLNTDPASLLPHPCPQLPVRREPESPQGCLVQGPQAFLPAHCRPGLPPGPETSRVPGTRLAGPGRLARSLEVGGPLLVTG